MKVVVTIEFEPTVAGVQEARGELERLETRLSGETVSPPPQSTSAAAIVAVYNRCVPEGRSRELLEALPGEEPGLTPEEIAEVLGPDEKGQTITKDSVRAILRNIARAEASLKDEGTIAEGVIVKNFDGYAREGAGRYGVRAEDREALDRYLGR